MLVKRTVGDERIGGLGGGGGGYGIVLSPSEYFDYTTERV